MDIFIVVMLLAAALFSAFLCVIPCPSYGFFLFLLSKWDNKFMQRLAYTHSFCIKLKPNTLGPFLHFVPLHKCEFTDAHRFRIRIKNGLEKTIPFRFVVRCLRCKQNDWVGLFPTHEDSIGNELFSVPLFHPFVQIAFRILHFYSQISLSC